MKRWNVIYTTFLWRNRYSRHSHCLNTLVHCRQLVGFQLNLYTNNGVNGLVHCIDRSRAGCRNVSFYHIWSHQFHGSGGDTRHPSGDLKTSQLPQHVRHARLVYDQSFEILVFQSTLLLLGHLLETSENSIKFLHVQVVPQFLQTGSDRVASRMLSKNDSGTRLSFTTHQANALGSHNLVCALVLDHTVLMNSRLVLECVGAYNSLVRLTNHSCVLRDHLGCWSDMNWIDSSVQFTSARSTLELAGSFQRKGHDNFFERGISSAFTDAVDGTFQLTGTVESTSKRIGSSQPKVILAVGTEYYLVCSLDIFTQLLDELSKLPRHVPTSGIWNIEGGCSCLDHFRKNSVEKFRLRSTGIFRREFDIITTQTLDELDGIDGNLYNLIGCFVKFRLHMDRAGGNKGMNSRELGALDSVP
mmetsp:Transcript_1717/g.2651  ORF Transcript_1717/g.2651 Transcript_1717/m.2651 type:complete len:415 (+) Transcript_1717:561-1805(+)